jgi:hypothetical protein
MGSYLARTLGYHGANFVMDDVILSHQFRCVGAGCGCGYGYGCVLTEIELCV